MRRPLAAAIALLLITTALAGKSERAIDDTDENSEDIFERPPRLESLDKGGPPLPPPGAFGVSPIPGEITMHRHHQGFGVAEDEENEDEDAARKTAAEEEENQGSDGFPRMTAMVEEPQAAAPPANETNHQQRPLLPLPKANEDRPLDGIRTDTRTGAKKLIEAPFPTLMANEERETIIQLTMAPNTTGGDGFGAALAQGERAPVAEYDLEEGRSSVEELEAPVERNLTAAVVFQDVTSTTTEAAETISTTTTTSAAPAASEAPAAPAGPAEETVTPHASHFPTRDRAGIFPSESTEQLTAHAQPTASVKPSSPSRTTPTEPNEATDPPFAMVDPTIFNPDHLFELPADAPAELPEEAKEDIEEEDSELKKALSSEAHLTTATIQSIMAAVSTTTPATPKRNEQDTEAAETPSSVASSAAPSTTTSTVAAGLEVTTTQKPTEHTTTTTFQLPPLVATASTASAPSTTTTEELSTTIASTTTSEAPSTAAHSTTPPPTTAHGHHTGHHHAPPPTPDVEEVHFEDRPVETTEAMPFDPTSAHFGDSREGEELWRSTHGQQHGAETTTTAPLIAHKTPFHVAVADLDYFADFADPDSGKFRKLRDQILPDLRRDFEKALPDFIAVDLTSVEKEARTVVHGVVYTRTRIVDLYETANKIEAELEAHQMKLGGNGVAAGSFTINGINARAPIERVQQTATSAEGSIAFIVAGIITIGVILILIVVFVIVLTRKDSSGHRTIALFMNNHRRGVGSIKLKEDAEAEAGRRAQVHYGNVNLMSYNSPPPPQPPSTQLLQSLPHVVINTKAGSRPSSVGRPSSTISPSSDHSSHRI